MKEILFGTTNEAKLQQIKGVLFPAGIRVSRIVGINALPEVVEDGQTAVENARKKALTFAKFFGKVIFSMDNALYLDGLEDLRQPGLHVRRLKGYPERPTDQQMIRYYSDLISSLGERVNGYWEYGFCIATPGGMHKETIIKAPRIFVSKPSLKIESGYPLESISIEPENGKYMSEMTREEQDLFWQKAIGERLLQFVQSVNL